MGDLEEIETNIYKTEKALKKEKKILVSIMEQNAKADEAILKFEEEIRKKNRELEHLEPGFFEFLTGRAEKRQKNIIANISRLETDIKIQQNSKQSKLGSETKIQTLEEELICIKKKVYLPGRVWSSYPEALDEKMKNKYLELFMEMPSSLNCESNYINMVLLGETGSGKSSFLNACETALKDTIFLSDTFKVAPVSHVHSTTTTLHLVELKTRQNDLPVRFYDCPGLMDGGAIDPEVLNMIVNGQVKANAEITSASKMRKDITKLRLNPEPGDMMHCIIYVVRADSNVDVTATPSLQILKEFHENRNKEDDPRSFALVTAVDEIGVPNSDMENVYRYPCVKKICKKVSKVLDIPLTNVLPMSNYFEEISSTTSKNCMALMNMWRMVNSGLSYAEASSAKRNARDGFFE